MMPAETIASKQLSESQREIIADALKVYRLTCKGYLNRCAPEAIPAAKERLRVAEYLIERTEQAKEIHYLFE